MTLQEMIDAAQKEAVGLTVASGFVSEAAEQVAKENHNNAVSACKELVQVATNNLKSAVGELRNLRNQEKEQAAKVKKMDRAVKFFADTGNPFPMFAVFNGHKKAVSPVRDFCYSVGIAVPADDSPAWDIPSDWSKE